MKKSRGGSFGFGFLLFFFALLICYSEVIGESETSIKNKSSETGITHTEEAPFSEETIEDIKERESKKPAIPSEQRVIPFQKGPPPTELPEPCLNGLENRHKTSPLHETIKPDQTEERHEKKE